MIPRIKLKYVMSNIPEQRLQAFIINWNNFNEEQMNYVALKLNQYVIIGIERD